METKFKSIRLVAKKPAWNGREMATPYYVKTITEGRGARSGNIAYQGPYWTLAEGREALNQAQRKSAGLA